MEWHLTFVKCWLWLQQNVNVFPLASRVIHGVVTLGNLISQMVSSKVLPTDPAEKALNRKFRKVKLNMTLGQLSRILEKEHFVLAVQSQIVGKCKLIMVINLYSSRFIVV
jgi:cystathionine beta-synthase